VGFAGVAGEALVMGAVLVPALALALGAGTIRASVQSGTGEGASAVPVTSSSPMRPRTKLVSCTSFLGANAVSSAARVVGSVIFT
jgi:hypothetical protein